MKTWTFFRAKEGKNKKKTVEDAPKVKTKKGKSFFNLPEGSKHEIKKLDISAAEVEAKETEKNKNRGSIFVRFKKKIRTPNKENRPVLVVTKSLETALGDEDIEDIRERQRYVFTAGGRLSRHTASAISFLATQIYQVESNFNPKDAFYEENLALFRRHILAWKAGLMVPRQKKGKFVGEIPLTGTGACMKGISKFTRLLRFLAKTSPFLRLHSYMTEDYLKANSLTRFLTQEKESKQNVSNISMQTIVEGNTLSYLDLYFKALKADSDTNTMKVIVKQGEKCRFCEPPKLSLQ